MVPMGKWLVSKKSSTPKIDWIMMPQKTWWSPNLPMMQTCWSKISAKTFLHFVEPTIKEWKYMDIMGKCHVSNHQFSGYMLVFWGIRWRSCWNWFSNDPKFVSWVVSPTNGEVSNLLIYIGGYNNLFTSSTSRASQYPWSLTAKTKNAGKGRRIIGLPYWVLSVTFQGRIFCWFQLRKGTLSWKTLWDQLNIPDWKMDPEWVDENGYSEPAMVGVFSGSSR